MCPKAIRGGEATLVAFVAGKVRGPDGARLRAHLEDCERCRDYVEGQRAIWQLLDDWQPELQNTNFNSDFASRLAHLPPEPWFVEIGRLVAARMLKPAFTFSAIAAVLAVSREVASLRPDSPFLKAALALLNGGDTTAAS